MGHLMSTKIAKKMETRTRKMVPLQNPRVRKSRKGRIRLPKYPRNLNTSPKVQMLLSNKMKMLVTIRLRNILRRVLMSKGDSRRWRLLRRKNLAKKWIPPPEQLLWRLPLGAQSLLLLRRRRRTITTSSQCGKRMWSYSVWVSVGWSIMNIGLSCC